MNKKRIIIILVIAAAAVLILIYGLSQGRNDAKMVFKLPSGFISLEEAITSSKGDLSYVGWESQISFLNSDGTCIYQTSFNDDSFIVKGKYYISESKYNELLEIAADNRK